MQDVQANRTPGTSASKGNPDCLVTALIGGGLTFCGLARRSIFGLAVAALGFSMVRKAMGGTCSLADFGLGGLDEDKAVKRLGRPMYSGGDENSDAVEEASMESFPASDAPAYSRGSA